MWTWEKFKTLPPHIAESLQKLQAQMTPAVDGLSIEWRQHREGPLFVIESHIFGGLVPTPNCGVTPPLKRRSKDYGPSMRSHQLTLPW